MTTRILVGDVRARLADLEADSVDCVVTSPPYWALRDYDVDGQLGMEPTPQEHVAAMVEVFLEVRRVLKPSGVCWVNYGDSYASSVNGRSAADTKAAGNDDRTFRDKPFSNVVGPIKAKDCCNIPERFLIAMQEEGWWVRSKLPWLKRNSMPESISDRPAASVEWVFMFTRSARYWYDAKAVMLPVSPSTHLRVSQNVAAQIGSARANGGRKTNGNMKAVVRSPKIQAPGQGIKNNHSFIDSVALSVEERNFRNTDLFWMSLVSPLGLISNDDGTPLALDVPPKGFSEAHFATFPTKLIEPLILASCPPGGTVLDPFFGAGTTGLVAEYLGRHCIGIELNPEYARLAQRRIRAGLARVEAPDIADENGGDLPLFGSVPA